MKKLLYLLVFLMVAGGCVGAKYTSIEQVPAKERPLNEVIMAYQLCAGNAFADVLEKGGEPLDPNLFDEQAETAVNSCPTQLDAVSAFVLERTKDESVAAKSADKLKGRVKEQLLDHLQEFLEGK